MHFAKIATAPIIAVAFALWSPDVSAEAGEALERGQDLVRSFDYNDAIEAFQSVVDAPDATPTQRLEALGRIGSVHFRQRDEAQARDAFHRLLNLDPEHELDQRAFSPRMRTFFGEIRDGYEPVVGLTLDVAAVPDEEGDGRARLAVSLAGAAGGVSEVVALVRTETDGDFEATVMNAEGSEYVAQMELPAEGTAIDFYVEARAPSGFVLARQGSPDEPETFEVALVVEDATETVAPVEIATVESTRRPWYRTWWFWTIVGAVVVGGTTTAVVLALPEDQESGNLGSGHLE